ncbi:MAG: 3-deoxy-8-phosphooctulonate synthase [Bacteriovoracia bacterium]
MSDKLELMIGPCVLETEEITMEIAHGLSEQLRPWRDQVEFIFKGSFDKANRTSISSFRGPGLETGLKWLEKVKKEFKFPILTDFHLPQQADEIVDVADVIQIPAFLCRQTDMIVAAAQAAHNKKRRLNIKKGQFLSPEDAGNLVGKASRILSKEQIRLTERGVSFGYNNLIVDMASFQIMKSFGVKTIHDATHCVQRPGGLGNQTGGKREQIEVLAKAAVAAGADGVFIETHPRPEESKSDAATSWPLDNVGELVEKLVKLYNCIKEI